MAETAANEPSMEEILASIRKIISEDGATVQAADPPDAILDLTEEVAPAPEPVAAAPAPEPVAELPADPVIEMEDTPPAAPATPAPQVEVETGDGLVSDAAAAASAAALGGLAGLRTQATITSFPIGNGSATLEGMVLEFIRPQLKAWLDANLPTLVERIVQKEIQKITRDLR